MPFHVLFCFDFSEAGLEDADKVSNQLQSTSISSDGTHISLFICIISPFILFYVVLEFILYALFVLRYILFLLICNQLRNNCTAWWLILEF